MKEEILEKKGNKESEDTSVSGTQDELWLHQAQRDGDNRRRLRKKEEKRQKEEQRSHIKTALIVVIKRKHSPEQMQVELEGSQQVRPTLGTNRFGGAPGFNA